MNVQPHLKGMRIKTSSATFCFGGCIACRKPVAGRDGQEELRTRHEDSGISKCLHCKRETVREQDGFNVFSDSPTPMHALLLVHMSFAYWGSFKILDNSFNARMCACMCAFLACSFQKENQFTDAGVEFARAVLFKGRTEKEEKKAMKKLAALFQDIKVDGWERQVPN